MVQSPLSDMVAAYGPDATDAPASDVPSNVTTRLVTVSPSSCDVTLIGGGVVSLVFVVVGAAVVVAAAVATVASEDSTDVGSSATSVVVEAGSVVVVVSDSDGAESSVIEAGSGATVVATRASDSVTRRPSTAEATLAETSLTAVVEVVDAVSSINGDEPGENAAKPTTAMSAVMSSAAYARGMRGFTMLRGLGVLRRSSVSHGADPNGGWSAIRLADAQVLHPRV